MFIPLTYKHTYQIYTTHFTYRLHVSSIVDYNEPVLINMIKATKRCDLYIDLQGFWTCPLSHFLKNEHASANVYVPFLGGGGE